jgi:hypothetical protein
MISSKGEHSQAGHTAKVALLAAVILKVVNTPLSSKP